MGQGLREWLLDFSDAANNFPKLIRLPSADFKQWFLANGGYIDPAIEITSTAFNGTYLRVSGAESLLPGTEIISCPHHLTISWLSIRKCHLHNVCSTMKLHVATRLFLMKQHILREKSPWWPYIKILPQPYRSDAFNTPLYYNTEDMVWIRGTNLEYARQVREATWRKEYNDARQQLFGVRPSLEQGQIWSWFVCVVFERS